MQPMHPYQYHPKVPWLWVEPVLGAFHLVDTRTNTIYPFGMSVMTVAEKDRAMRAFHQKAAQLISEANRAQGRSGGWGDFVKGVAGFFGFKEQCTPCARRHAAWNARNYR